MLLAMSNGSLNRVDAPQLFETIERRVLGEGLTGAPEEANPELIPRPVGGFNDVIPYGQELGGGTNFYNTLGGVSQLVMLLAVTPNPAIREIVDGTVGSGSIALMRTLRHEQVLGEARALDLGSGRIPAFALAAGSLGAVVDTADAGRLHPGVHDEQAARHIQVDLTVPDAADTIQQRTGGNFDFVTTSVPQLVGNEDRGLRAPTMPELGAIGSRLLKPGGHFYAAGSNLLQKSDSVS
jgi:hypothetical protein